VEQLLRADPATTHSLRALAATAGMSRFHFIRAFKHAYGLPPHAYLLQLRVERAAELIRSSDLPLTTIAHDLGFGSSSRLSEAIRRRYGQTPSSLRRGRRAISRK
jgi:AraC-like DNA-binding protein